MTKRILALALALCMAFSALPMGVQAQSLREEVLQLNRNEIRAAQVQSDEELDVIQENLTAPQLRAVGDKVYDEESTEPNNDFDSAPLVENDYTVVGTLPEDDQDYFVFELETSSQISIVLVGTTEDLIIVLADLDEGEYLYESVYLEYDEKNKVHAIGLGVELDAGLYGFLVAENEGREAEYEFYFQTQPTDSHTHSYTAVVTVPTCTEAGYTTYTCSCGDSYVADEVPALGHSWDEGTVTKEPTETEKGVRTFTCTVCGETRTEEIPVLEHTHKYTAVVTAPTCTEKGYTTYTCACGDTYTADEVPALDHKEVIDAAVAATCTEKGLTEGSHCEVCKSVIKAQEEIPALGHKEVIDAAVAATCTEKGLTEGIHCEVCKTVITAQEEIPALGHDYVDGICSACGEKVPEGSMQCGEKLYALFDEQTGTLTIFGTGAMYDFSGQNEAPWKELPLVKVVVENGVASIGSQAFYRVATLTEVVLPESVTYIGDEAFFLCENLETIKIPSKATYIGEFAFHQCYKLNNITIPATLTRLEDYVFSGCEAMTAITVPGTVKEIGEYVLAGCSVLKDVVLEEGIPAVGNGMFTGCNALETLVVPASVTYMGYEAFYDTALKEITFLGDAPDFESDCFLECVATAKYPAKNTTWTEKKLKDYGGTITWMPYQKEEDASGKCGENLTWKYEAATDTLTITGTGAMYDYTVDEPAPWIAQGLYVVKATLEEGATTVGDCAFADIPELTQVSLCDTVTRIGVKAFTWCDNLTAVNIPAGVTFIGEFAFHQCPKLNNVTLPAGLTSLEMYVFDGCTSLTSITVPGSVKTIMEYAFAGCTALKEVIIEEGVPEIGDCMFVSSSALESIVIPASVKEIGYEAFFETSLKEITFLGDAPVFGEACFAECVATAYYPVNNKTWTEEVMQDYYGTITWVPVGEPLPFDRVYGATRCETAYEIADLMKEVLGVEKFSSIIIANGDNFADALGGSFLANRKGAPILLYRKGYEDENLAYITGNLASGGTVYILGGTGVVPQSMEEALKGFNVKRLAGETRFETNLAILNEAGVTGQEILISNGWEFADALSASATGLPILMVDSINEKLTDGQIAFLKAHAENTYTVIGGSGAVSTELEEMIEVTIERQVGRVAGGFREETSVNVANTYFTEPTSVILAYSRNFPDGLCGGPLAYAMNVPLLLVNQRLESSAAGYVKANGIKEGIILGGSVNVTDESGKIVFGIE